ncbi:MAG: nitrile hydratase subunit beta [Steroidobacteraceae bacterium]
MSYRSNADLGGKELRGAIVQEPEGELFHAPWEARAMALTLAMGATGLWNIDMSRAARETLVNYRDLSYYEIWLAALQKLLSDSGALNEPASAPRVLRAESVAAVLARGAPTSRKVPDAARFAVGDTVRTRAGQPDHHTRLPGYARGKIGVVTRVHGAHVFADANAGGLGECPQWLYTIAFEERELWGDGLPAQRSTVSVDAWEPYLKAARRP